SPYTLLFRSRHRIFPGRSPLRRILGGRKLTRSAERILAKARSAGGVRREVDARPFGTEFAVGDITQTHLFQSRRGGRFEHEPGEHPVAFDRCTASEQSRVENHVPFGLVHFHETRRGLTFEERS